jgi:hypothetical protein
LPFVRQVVFDRFGDADVLRTTRASLPKCILVLFSRL